jgi:hypothetical protein
MPDVLRVGEVYLPLDNEVPARDRGVTGDAGALSVGGGGGGGGDFASTLFLLFREAGSPSSSEVKSESCRDLSVSVTMSKAPPNRLQQIKNERNTAQLYTPQSFARKDVKQKQTHIPQIAMYLLVHEYTTSIRVKLYKTIKNIHSPVTVKICNTSC